MTDEPITTSAARRRGRRVCALCGADVAIKNNGALFLHGCQARQRDGRNALRLPVVSPLREVVETIQHDDVVRVERLSCGHTKTTMTASQRPAQRRRCLKCEADNA